MYQITTFVADHIPTKYEKPADRGRDGPPGGGAPMPVGTETVVEYETYNECMTQLALYSEQMSIEKAIRLKKAKKLGNKAPAMAWTAHKMYNLAKQPGLLHYIDNNYPGISLHSEAGEKV